ncbi:MAG: acetate--CoA ligase family protein [Syntrophobacteraceae bacterium]|jgi:hypothetical protein|nr:acetate--CoA ligase family protein [Syntrophobacteraceae bacterium]
MILPEHEANRMLSAAGIPMIPLSIVNSTEEAVKEAAILGYPVVLKFSSAIHTHKTEIGGVILGIGDETELAEAFTKLHDLRGRLDPDAVLILEPMAGLGAEVFVGFQRHPQFGPVLSFGLGGTSLELFRDVAFRLLPSRAADFHEMLSELGSWPRIRGGFRNLPPVDEENVVHFLLQAADFVLSRPDIDEMDLNPVIMGSRGPTVTDATIVLGSG